MVTRKYFIQLSKRGGRFWRIEVTGKSFTVTSGMLGTFGRACTCSFPGERECLREADKLIGMYRQRGYIESDDNMMTGHALPPEVKQSLATAAGRDRPGAKLRCVSGDQVALITLVIDSPQEDAAPPGRNDGVYATLAYALTALPPRGDRQRVLVWVPAVSLFGMWLPGDRRLQVFPGVAWCDIEADLAHHARACETGMYPDIQDHLCINEYLDFISRDFSANVEHILSMREDRRESAVSAFLQRYEQALNRLPVCHDLTDAFESLVKLYYRMGVWQEGNSKYGEAIIWFKKSLVILNQSYRLRSEVFSDIFLQLGFCCLETAKFDEAIRYIDIYQRYDAGAWEACDQIKASIRRSQQLYKETMSSYLREMEEKSHNGRDEVTGLIEKTVRLFPNDPVLHFNLACFFAVSERISDALYHFEEALKKGFANREKMLDEQDLQNVKHTRAFEDIRLRYL